MAKFIGIDYSLTSPAVVICGSKIEANCKGYYLTDKIKLTGQIDTGMCNILGILHDEYYSEQERYENIATWVLDILNGLDDRDIYIMIEDYSFGSKGKVFHIAENCGLMKYMLYKNEYDFDTVSPSTLKKFATGKGNADKQLMYNSFCVDSGVQNLHKIISPTTKLGNPTTDIVDAWYLARYMKYKYETEV